MAGPLTGVKVIELAGIGPAPFCGMMLADLGADVIRVDRTTDGRSMVAIGISHRIMHRGRRSIAVDLKHPAGAETVLRLVEGADVLIEGFRPGITEKLGLGPDVCLARNPRLVYGRMTGWGQDGPLADRAGHDIDYLAVAGGLSLIGRPGQRPTVPLNLVADFGGGGMLLAVGVLAALTSARVTGAGQVVDAAMVDGVAALLAMPLAMRAAGVAPGGRGENLLDGGAPFYDTYECSDGGYVAVGALEPQFYAELLRGLDLADDDTLPHQMDVTGWPALRERFAAIFATRGRDEWAAHFDGTDACVAPVLGPEEAAMHPHLTARGTYVRDDDGQLQPAPAPRFGRTPTEAQPSASPQPGDHTREVLIEAGLEPADIDALLADGAIARG